MVFPANFYASGLIARIWSIIFDKSSDMRSLTTYVIFISSNIGRLFIPRGVESFLYLKYYIIDLYVRTMVKRKIIVLYQS